jgi:hypothetical protein
MNYGTGNPTANYGNSSAPITGQPGELDNRLTLSPADNPEIKDWEDGKKYRFVIEATQIAPGEFSPRVISADAVDEAGASDQASPENPAPESTPSEADSDYPNPAVAKVMGDMRG